jgi:hypothetical protein
MFLKTNQYRQAYVLVPFTELFTWGGGGGGLKTIIAAPCGLLIYV